MAINPNNADLETTVQHQFLLTGICRQVIDGIPHWVLQLDDHTGQRQLLVPARLMTFPKALPVPVAIHEAIGNPVPLAGPIVRIVELSAEDIFNAGELLPQVECPEEAQPAMQELVNYTGSISTAPLKYFLARVLLDPKIGLPLLRSPASRKYHHPEPGGLLVHSVDGLRPGAAMCWSANLTVEETDLTLIGYLLHDVGKLATLSPGASAFARATNHNVLTLEILAPHLAWLDAKSRELGERLRYILSYAGRSSTRRGDYPQFVGADIVNWLDQLSTATYRQQLKRAADGSVETEAVTA